MRALVIGGVIALTVGASAFAAAPLTKGVYGGVIVVGRGAAGVRLGMSRAQVIARLGRPYKEIKNVYMAYERLPPGRVDERTPHGIFDLYLNSGRVRMFVISPHSGWCLPDGNHVFTKGAVGRLMHRYGRRLRLTRIEDGELAYRITERYLGHTVWTEFYVARPGAKASIYGADVLFPLGR